MKGIAKAAAVAVLVLAVFVAGGAVIVGVLPDWLTDPERNYWGWAAVKLAWALICLTAGLAEYARRVGSEQWFDGFNRGWDSGCKTALSQTADHADA